jgi:hypothetical protein
LGSGLLLCSSFSKIKDVVQTFGLLLFTVKATKKLATTGLGNILGDIFTNSDLKPAFFFSFFFSSFLFFVPFEKLLPMQLGAEPKLSSKENLEQGCQILLCPNIPNRKNIPNGHKLHIPEGH